MPAPANDNLANAQLIGSAANRVAGTNVGTTAQANEPGQYLGRVRLGETLDPPRYVIGDRAYRQHYEKTVWYRWVAPDNFYRRPWCFSTRADPAHAELWPQRPLRTVLQIFAAPLGAQTANVADLIEVSENADWYPARYWPAVPVSIPPVGWGSLYLFDNLSRPYQANGFERASEIFFRPKRNWNYYIRVDGLNGEEGPFVLRWFEHAHKYLVNRALDRVGFQAYLDPTSVWRPGQNEVYAGHATVGEVTLNNLDIPFTVDGIIPPGNYVVRYLSGAWVNDRELGIRVPPAGDWDQRPLPEWATWLRANEMQGCPPWNWCEVVLNGTPITEQNPGLMGRAWLGNNLEHGVSYQTYEEAEWGAYGSEMYFSVEDYATLLLRYSDDATIEDDVSAQLVNPAFENPTFILYRIV